MCSSSQNIPLEQYDPQTTKKPIKTATATTSHITYMYNLYTMTDIDGNSLPAQWTTDSKEGTQVDLNSIVNHMKDRALPITLLWKPTEVHVNTKNESYYKPILSLTCAQSHVATLQDYFDRKLDEAVASIRAGKFSREKLVSISRAFQYLDEAHDTMEVCYRKAPEYFKDLPKTQAILRVEREKDRAMKQKYRTIVLHS